MTYEEYLKTFENPDDPLVLDEAAWYEAVAYKKDKKIMEASEDRYAPEKLDFPEGTDVVRRALIKGGKDYSKGLAGLYIVRDSNFTSLKIYNEYKECLISFRAEDDGTIIVSGEV